MTFVVNEPNITVCVPEKRFKPVKFGILLLHRFAT